MQAIGLKIKSNEKNKDRTTSHNTNTEVGDYLI